MPVNNMSDTKPKTTRTPRNLETITKGALALPLIERATLRDALVESIEKEKAELREAADKASKL